MERPWAIMRWTVLAKILSVTLITASHSDNVSAISDKMLRGRGSSKAKNKQDEKKCPTSRCSLKEEDRKDRSTQPGQPEGFLATPILREFKSYKRVTDKGMLMHNLPV